MKTSWNEARQIDEHLSGTMETGNALVFEAKLLLDAELGDKVLWQRKTHSVIKQFGRRQLKNELEAIHQKLFTSPEHRSFGQKIRRLFTKP
jgi:hypothetical protein